MKKTILIFAILLAAFTINAQNSIEGIWYNTTKTGKVEIYKKGDQYFGKIVWIKDALSEKTGQPKTDEFNPEEKLRSTPIIGLQVLKNFTYDGDGKFSGGTIYDPENGKTYKCKMTLQDNDHLDVRGYIGLPALGRTENWTRASK